MVYLRGIKNMNKSWMLLMVGQNSLEDLKELWEPIESYFNGLVVTYHGEKEDIEAKYLESVKKEGRVIYLPYSNRHDFSRNAYLYCGPIQDGDICCQCDLLERPVPNFLENNLKVITNYISLGLFNCCDYYGKPFIFEFHESLKYAGSPHETLIRQDGNMKRVELNNQFPNESDVRINMRPIKRTDEFNWVNHYTRYMLMPWGSNHCLLGLEKNGDPSVLFPIREAKRLAFREEMKQRGFALTIDGLKSMLLGEIDEKLKNMINEEKTWADFYQYHILNNKNVLHSHEWKDIIKIS